MCCVSERIAAQPSVGEQTKKESRFGHRLSASPHLRNKVRRRVSGKQAGELRSTNRPPTSGTRPGPERAAKSESASETSYRAPNAAASPVRCEAFGRPPSPYRTHPSECPPRMRLASGCQRLSRPQNGTHLATMRQLPSVAHAASIPQQAILQTR